MPSVTNQKGGKQTKAFSNGSVIDRITPIGFDKNDGIKVLTYGRSGTGKTTLWGSFPSPILAMIVSGGKRPGELRSLDTPENKKRIKQVVIHNSQEILTLAKYQEEQAPFATVVLDHVSGLQDRVLAEILGMERVPEQKGWGLASQQQYGQCTMQCKELLRSILNLECNAVVVGQEREFNNEGDASEILEPFVSVGLTPSLAGWLTTSMDYVCQTFLRQKTEMVETKVGGKTIQVPQRTKESEYCLRTGPSAVYATKFRVPKGQKLPDVIVDADYGKIMKVIQGK